MSTGNTDGQLIAAPPTCPGDTFTFSCNVTGDSNGDTLWRAGGGGACLLEHMNTGDSDTCGPGDVFTAMLESTSPTSFPSTLSGTATAALDGTLVECFGPLLSTDAGNRVGNHTLQIVG